MTDTLTPLEEAQSYYSDFYKELYDVRPRHATAEQWNSLEWLEKQIAALQEDAPRVAAEHRARENAAIERFEALVKTTIEAGAGNRVLALKWLREAQNDEHAEIDDEYFEYCHGLPYGYLKRTAG